MSNSKLNNFAQIPTDVGGLTIRVTAATVNIRHEDCAQIILRATQTTNWTVEGGSIYQTEAASSTNSGNSVCISGSMRNSCIIVGNGNFVSTDSGCDMQHQVVTSGNSEVWVNERKISAATQVSNNSKGNDPDKLEIIVPNSFSGNLKLSNAGSSDVEIDYWQGSKLEIMVSGRGGFKVTGRCDVKEIQMLGSGRGNLEFESIAAQSLQANVSGRGDLTIEELNAETFSLQQSGTGDAVVHSGRAKLGNIVNSGTGDTRLRGSFANVSQSNSGAETVKIRVID